MTSQPSLAAIIAATDHTDRATGLSLDAVGDLEPYWEAVRRVHAPFEAGLASPTGTVYRHEIPGGQLSNLRQQAIALGLGQRFEEVERAYAACNELLGRPIKVTPSSKVVGDLALHMVASGVTPDQLKADPAAVDLPDSVIGFLRGELGVPAGGFPEPFRTAALVGRAPAPPPTQLSVDDEMSLSWGAPRSTLDRLLFPGPAASQLEMSERHGDLSVLPSLLFWYGLREGPDDVLVGLDRGVRLLVGVEAIGEPNDEGIRTVVFRLNGQLRLVDAVDLSVAPKGTTAVRADPEDPGHVAAPFRGLVTAAVGVGDRVEAGENVATIEAMKMESAISASVSGIVTRVILPEAAPAEPGDLILEIRPDGVSPTTGTDTGG